MSCEDTEGGGEGVGRSRNSARSYKQKPRIKEIDKGVLSLHRRGSPSLHRFVQHGNRQLRA
jgi:hypothetical protein